MCTHLLSINLSSRCQGERRYRQPREPSKTKFNGKKERKVSTVPGIYLWLQYRIDMLRDKERGAAAVEYGLLVGLIAVAIILAVTFLGDTLKGLFESIGNKLAPSAPAAP